LMKIELSSKQRIIMKPLIKQVLSFVVLVDDITHAQHQLSFAQKHTCVS
jgi:hypothetical protein